MGERDVLTFGSLFAGIGGFDLGFTRAGMRCSWSVEIDDRCNEVRTHHWPDVKQYKDVKDVGQHNLKPVDVICGGFPCQDLSVAGRRAGLAGERSGLWWEFHRIIEELQPRWVIIENVPGLLSSNSGRDMGTIVGALGKLRYGYAWATLDAQYFGVAQRRRRVFIVGCLGDWRGAAQVLFEPESGQRDSAPSRETGASITQAITRRLGSSGPDDNRAQAHHLVVGQCHGSNVGPLGALRAGNSGVTGGDPGVVAFSRQDDGRDATIGLSPTMRVGTSLGDKAGMPGNLAIADVINAVRRLTPLECERLQGFPDTWTAVNGMSDSARYRMLGNTVAVSVAEWIGRRIMEVARNG